MRAPTFQQEQAVFPQRVVPAFVAVIYSGARRGHTGCIAHVGHWNVKGHGDTHTHTGTHTHSIAKQRSKHSKANTRVRSSNKHKDTMELPHLVTCKWTHLHTIVKRNTNKIVQPIMGPESTVQDVCVCVCVCVVLISKMLPLTSDVLGD